MNVAGQAERIVSARAFLWGCGAKVVVSDIENTIARRSGPCAFFPYNGKWPLPFEERWKGGRTKSWLGLDGHREVFLT